MHKQSVSCYIRMGVDVWKSVIQQACKLYQQVFTHTWQYLSSWVILAFLRSFDYSKIATSSWYWLAKSQLVVLLPEPGDRLPGSYQVILLDYLLEIHQWLWVKDFRIQDLRIASTMHQFTNIYHIVIKIGSLCISKQVLMNNYFETQPLATLW